MGEAGWNLEQFRAVLVRMAERRECSRCKSLYYGAVSEIKKEIPGKAA
jgi:hypothetical protein